MELIIAAAIIGAAVLYSRSQPAAAPINPPPPEVPSSAGPLISGGYTMPPASIGNFGAVLSAAAATGASSPSIRTPTVLPWAPPQIIGGIAGNAFTGGNPLGGLIRPGLTLGTATTVIAPPAPLSPKLSIVMPVIS